MVACSDWVGYSTKDEYDGYVLVDLES